MAHGRAALLPLPPSLDEQVEDESVEGEEEEDVDDVECGDMPFVAALRDRVKSSVGDIWGGGRGWHNFWAAG